MAKTRTFISFDYDHDARQKDLEIGLLAGREELAGGSEPETVADHCPAWTGGWRTAIIQDTQELGREQGTVDGSARIEQQASAARWVSSARDRVTPEKPAGNSSAI